MDTKKLILAIFLLAFILPACVSLESKLEDIEKDHGPGASFREACKAYDEEPDDPETMQFMLKYARKAYEYNINMADYYVVNQRLQAMTDILVYDKNSMKYLVEECKKRNIGLPDYDLDKMIRKYCNLYLGQNLEKANWELKNNDFVNLRKTLFAGSNSAQALKKFAKYFMVPLEKESRLNELETIAQQREGDFYDEAVKLYNLGQYEAALGYFKNMKGIKESDFYIKKCYAEINYSNALALFKAGQYRQAYREFAEMDPNFKDVAKKMDDCVELGSVRVALMYFPGPDGHILYERIVNELQKDRFIKIINTGNYAFSYIMSTKYAQENNIKYVISGIITEDVKPDKSVRRGDKKVWAVSDSPNEVKHKGNSQNRRWVWRSSRVSYNEVREEYRIIAGIQYRIDNAVTGELIKLRTLHDYASDEVYYYETIGRNHHDRFSFKNTALDTISASSEKYLNDWKPSYSEKSFQEHFTRSRVMKSRSELWEDAFGSLSGQVARAIANEIYRSERWD